MTTLAARSHFHQVMRVLLWPHKGVPQHTKIGIDCRTILVGHRGTTIDDGCMMRVCLRVESVGESVWGKVWWGWNDLVYLYLGVLRSKQDCDGRCHGKIATETEGAITSQSAGSWC
jgi:hypothetical protein